MSNERKVLSDLETAMVGCFLSKEALALPGRDQSQILIMAAAMLIKAAGNDPIVYLVSAALAIDSGRTTELVLRAAKTNATDGSN